MTDRRERRFWAPDVRKDVDDELAYHLEMRQREFVARGLSPAEAREMARRRFGNAERIAADCRDIDERRYREERRASMWNDFRQDVAYGVRLLRRAPGFTAVAVLTLALGIGATTAVFGVIDAAMLRPLPYPDPEQLVSISIEVTRADGRVSGLAPSEDDVNAWRGGEALSHATIWRGIFSPMIVDGREPERVGGRAISDDYLAMHGVVPALGRAFGADDMRRGAEPVVLLGHAYWQRRFGGRADVLGEALRIDGDIATVVGVLPPGFYADVPIWRPFHTTGHQPDRRGTGSTVYGRLQPGLTIEQAQQRLAAAVVSGAPDPAGRDVSGVQVRSLLSSTAAGYRYTTRVLAYAVGAILLIACINVAGLTLARGATRGPELGVRASMGAGRGRLVRQLLAESLVLSLAGGAAGVFLAWVSLDLLVANLPLELPANSPPAVNLRVLGLALAAAVTTGLLFGLAPAVRLSRVNLANALSHAGRRLGPAFSRRGGQTLIAAEVALAIVLLAGAGLMLRSFARMVSVDLGFDPRGVVAMEVEPLDIDAPRSRQYYIALVEALRGRPGIEAVGAVDYMPLVSGSTVTALRVDGRVVGDGQSTENIHIRHYLPGYFEALGLPLRSGRYPATADGGGGLRGALVNATAASLMFGDGPVLGRTFEQFLGEGTAAYQVVGVLDDARHWGPRETASPELYLPLSDRDPASSARCRHSIAARCRLACTHAARGRDIPGSAGDRAFGAQRIRCAAP